VALGDELLDILAKELLDHLIVGGPSAVNFKFQTLALGLGALELIQRILKSLIEGLLCHLEADDLGLEALDGPVLEAHFVE
jgi:hypothetical protein